MQSILIKSWLLASVSRPSAVKLTPITDTMFTILRMKILDVESWPSSLAKLVLILNLLKQNGRRLRNDAKQVSMLSSEMCMPRPRKLDMSSGIKSALKQVVDVAHHLSCHALHEVTLKVHLIFFEFSR
jgi:hypothetical protein